MSNVFVLVYMFQDLIDSIDVYKKKKDAVMAFNLFTGTSYDGMDDEQWERFGQGRYGGTQIYECEVKS